MKRAVCCMLLCMCAALGHAPAQKGEPEHWRPATEAELEAALPARATVEKEHIETEMRTANGLVNGRKEIVAVVVLITAGYASDGKYSHYLLRQAPMRALQGEAPGPVC